MVAPAVYSLPIKTYRSGLAPFPPLLGKEEERIFAFPHEGNLRLPVSLSSFKLFPLIFLVGEGGIGNCSSLLYFWVEDFAIPPCPTLVQMSFLTLYISSDAFGKKQLVDFSNRRLQFFSFGVNSEW